MAIPILAVFALVVIRGLMWVVHHDDVNSGLAAAAGQRAPLTSASDAPAERRASVNDDARRLLMPAADRTDDAVTRADASQ